MTFKTSMLNPKKSHTKVHNPNPLPTCSYKNYSLHYTFLPHK